MAIYYHIIPRERLRLALQEGLVPHRADRSSTMSFPEEYIDSRLFLARSLEEARQLIEDQHFSNPRSPVRFAILKIDLPYEPEIFEDDYGYLYIKGRRKYVNDRDVWR